ncbi:ankyrin repeat domain-containing protein [Diaphorobacter aerolatus]|uniref:Ankyrin repeat domain-containing protein n=1 Tax=Diaphorobacter aerolatus TaxID=1288495 RepID=A0A7H0GJA7_9BURK|nr:ankyrin repeat domain-containing protein [Diaphorobacter aerolatus]QNP48373.1 ankyrin repeat domain-containing protein [Diaphorobacter aerolatus]
MNPSQKTREQIFKAAQDGDTEQLNHLFGAGMVSSPMGIQDLQSVKNWALSQASQHGHLNAVENLLNRGAEIDSFGGNALGVAALNGHTQVVSYLLDHDADIHTEEDNALLNAAENNHLETVKVLIERGADPEAQDGQALLGAAFNDAKEVVEYFLIELSLDVSPNNQQRLKDNNASYALKVLAMRDDIATPEPAPAPTRTLKRGLL